jgi:hypothetical protein
VTVGVMFDGESFGENFHGYERQEMERASARASTGMKDRREFQREKV